jgi:nucleoside 2-deoxyribosyltransferase
MTIIYAGEHLPLKSKFSIFLAGPTPRRADVRSWRPELINALNKAGFTGDIFAPENRVLGSPYDFDQQIPWEVNGLYQSDLVVFWIPRDLQDMPGFTTNIEYGEWMHSGKIVVGFPQNAINTRYIKKRCEMNQTPLFHSIEELADYVCRYEKKFTKWYNVLIRKIFFFSKKLCCNRSSFFKKIT